MADPRTIGSASVRARRRLPSFTLTVEGEEVVRYHGAVPSKRRRRLCARDGHAPIGVVAGVHVRVYDGPWRWATMQMCPRCGAPADG